MLVIHSFCLNESKFTTWNGATLTTVYLNVPEHKNYQSVFNRAVNGRWYDTRSVDLWHGEQATEKIRV